MADEMTTARGESRLLLRVEEAYDMLAIKRTKFYALMLSGEKQGHAGFGSGGDRTRKAVEARTKRPHARFPRRPSLRSVFAYHSRAYPAVPQPWRQIDEGVAFLERLGFWFVWTGRDWGLECRRCGKPYIRAGHAGNHRCSPDLVDATSSERARRPSVR